MASRVELPVVTVPAGTPLSAPIDIPTLFDIGEVEAIEILVPPGPSGLVGFQITHSGEPVLPRESDRWIIADGEVIKWTLADMPTGRAWGVRAYNTDVHDHSLYLRYLIRETTPRPFADIPAIVITQPDQPTISMEDDPEMIATPPEGI